ncbi:MAG: aminopeptidase [Firmicutes bacterium]|nr:aminopeptidase [Bacillota bacterium]
MDRSKLRQFANLLVRVGGNVQPGQPVVVGCDVANAGIARLIAECAYDAGASEVIMNWSDEVCSQMKFLRAEEKVFDVYPDWAVRRFGHWDESGAAYLHVDSDDPDLMKNVAPERLRRHGIASSLATKEHMRAVMANSVRWSVIGAPSGAWAAKVFPGVPGEEALERLWEAIFEASRMNEGPDPVETWRRHNENFKARLDFLNGHKFRALKFRNSIGTDISVELPEGHVWCGGGDRARDGILFNPNIPTEEVYTMPLKSGVNGRAVGSKPLQFRGKLIENFELIFRDGKVVSYKAEKNGAILKNILENDEGASYLGEVALVADTSPIARMGLMFYNTLFDENAACHFALGKAYPSCIEGGGDKSEEELRDLGANDSLVHEDFMVGTADMSITGVSRDGTETPVFVRGDFISI